MRDLTAPQLNSNEPWLATIPIASRTSGLSRSEIYLLLKEGKIKAKKNRTRTLIVMGSLRDHVATMTEATY
jgi:hypothetical protein